MNNKPAGTENDSRAPWNDKSNGFDLGHLCPSCDDVRDEANQMINIENYETDEEYETELEKIIETAQLCRECYRLDRYELD